MLSVERNTKQTPGQRRDLGEIDGIRNSTLVGRMEIEEKGKKKSSHRNTMWNMKDSWSSLQISK